MKTKKVASYTALIVLLSIALTIMIFYRPTALAGDTRYEPVLTGSMEPALPVGSVVVIKPVETADLVVGDIICYRFSETTLITHRIIDISQGNFVTKGDANGEPDSAKVAPDRVVGRVTFMIPFMGNIGSFIRTPSGFCLLFLIPGFLLIFLEVKKIIKVRKEPASR